MKNDAEKNYYEILKVDRNASIEELKAAKKERKFGSEATFSMWRLIDEAYEVLSDPEKRKKYDETLLQQDNDIFSNSDHTPLSIFDSDEEYGYEDDRLSANADISFKEDVLPHIKNLSKEAVIAVPTVVMTGVTIIKELSKNAKYKLEKEKLENSKEKPKEKAITEIETEDSKLEKEYREKLEKRIDEKFNQYHNNYDLQIDKVRFETRIELLKKRIEQKENQTVKRFHFLQYKLELTALRRELDVFEKRLEIINEKIEENQRDKTKQNLTRINDKLINVNKELSELSKSETKKTLSIKRLEIRKKTLEKIKKSKIQRQKIFRECYAVFSDSFVSARSNASNFVESFFKPIEEIEEKHRTL